MPSGLRSPGSWPGTAGLTREAYSLDLRQFTSWCRIRSLPLFTVRRADIETFARELEARGRARATVTRRLCTIAGFCKYAVGEELLDHSPAARVRRPRLDYESHATALEATSSTDPPASDRPADEVIAAAEPAFTPPDRRPPGIW